MNSLGELIKQKRIERGMTLRRFCSEAKLDPSNWSKIERGLLEGPKSDKILREIANVLNLKEEEFQEMKDLAVIESIPDDIKPEQNILDALPVFFRTARELKPTEEELKKLIELLKKN